MLAPRVNAAGRMSTPDIATRLLLATDEALGEEARALAQQLDGENIRRQEEEAEIVAAAKKIVADRSRRRRAHRARRRRARAGTAASSASSRRSSSTRFTGRPSCCRSTATSRTARAAASRASTCSARSSAARDLLHPLRRPQAGRRPDAGRRRGSGSSARAVNAVADETLGPDDLMPRLRIDGDLDVPRHHRRRSRPASRRWRRSAPAIRGRSSPRAASRSSTARASSRSATSRWRSSRTAASSARSPGAPPSAHDFLAEHKAALDVAFSLEQNEFNGETYLELTLADVEVGRVARTRSRDPARSSRNRRCAGRSRTRRAWRSWPWRCASPSGSRSSAAARTAAGRAARPHRSRGRRREHRAARRCASTSGARRRSRRVRAAADLRRTARRSCIGVTVVDRRPRRRPHRSSSPAKEGDVGKDESIVDAERRREAGRRATASTVTHRPRDLRQTATAWSGRRARWSSRADGCRARHRHDLRQERATSLTILDQAVVHVAPDEDGAGARRRHGRRGDVRAARADTCGSSAMRADHARRRRSSRPTPAIAHLTPGRRAGRDARAARQRDASPAAPRRPAACKALSGAATST